MLTKRELKDIRWILLTNIKDIDDKMLKSKDAYDIHDYELAKSDYERLFNKIDILIHKSM